MNWILVFTFLIGSGEDAMMKREIHRTPTYKDCVAKAKQLSESHKRRTYSCKHI